MKRIFLILQDNSYTVVDGDSPKKHCDIDSIGVILDYKYTPEDTVTLTVEVLRNIIKGSRDGK
jgi:hypothetical protein